GPAGRARGRPAPTGGAGGATGTRLGPGTGLRRAGRDRDRPAGGPTRRVRESPTAARSGNGRVGWSGSRGSRPGLRARPSRSPRRDGPAPVRPDSPPTDTTRRPPASGRHRAYRAAATAASRPGRAARAGPRCHAGSGHAETLRGGGRGTTTIPPVAARPPVAVPFLPALAAWVAAPVRRPRSVAPGRPGLGGGRPRSGLSAMGRTAQNAPAA